MNTLEVYELCALVNNVPGLRLGQAFINLAIKDSSGEAMYTLWDVTDNSKALTIIDGIMAELQWQSIPVLEGSGEYYLKQLQEIAGEK